LRYCDSTLSPPLDNGTFQNFVYHCFVNNYSYSKVNTTRAALLFWCNIHDIKFQLSKLSSLGLRAYKRHYLRQKPNIWMPVEHLLAIMGSFSEVQLQYFCLLCISFYTLVRPAEIMFLKWKHVNFDNKFVTLPWSKNDPYGEGTYVFLLDPALAAFQRLANAYNGIPLQDELIFPIKQATLNGWLARKCEQLQLPRYTWYALKHGGATYLTLIGWSYRQIMNHGC
jgi:integrase